jgi:hypothetical protein
VSACKICGTSHSERLHEAVLRTRAWLRAETLAALKRIPKPKIQTRRQPGGIVIPPNWRRR